MKLIWSLLLAISVSSAYAFAEESETQTPAQSAFVKDNLTIYMHSGSGRNYRIIGTVEAGSAIQISQNITNDDEIAFAEVTLDNGKTGWIESQYINTSGDSLRQQLTQIQAQSEEFSQIQQQHNAQLSNLEQEKSAMAEQLQQAQAALKDAQANLNAANKQKQALSAQAAQQEQSELLDWFVKGGGMALLSVVIGFFMGKKARKNKNFF